MGEDWQAHLAALRALMGDSDEPEEAPAEVAEESPAARQRGMLDIVFERKGRAGKSATIISGFTIADVDVDAIAATLKKKIGSGGSARGGEILIQGDRRRDVLAHLKAMGFKARVI